MIKRCLTGFCLVLLMAFISCNHKEKKVTLTVKNEYITYVDSSETIQFNNYKNDSIRKKATNVITYTINNPTDKKLIFVFDSNLIEPSYFKKHGDSGFIGYYIKDVNEEFLKPSMPSVNFAKGTGELIKCMVREDSINKSYYKIIGLEEKNIVNVDNYFRNSITVYPDEKKTFKSVVSFPVIWEIDRKSWRPPLYISNMKETNTFQLFYEFHTDEFKKSLPKYILEELEHNETEFFDGRLLSNKVPLKKIE